LILLACLTACSPARLLVAGVPQDGFTVERGIPYEDGERHQLDIYQPVHPLPGNPVIVFFYGGEWKYGERQDYGFVAEPLADAGVTVVVPDYRLYPPTAFPGFIEDGAVSVAWVRDHISQHGGNPKSLFVMGHSAGAYIAAMLAVNPAYLGKVGMKPGDLSGFIGVSGPYNFLPITWPELKPIFEVVPDLGVTQPISFVDGQNPPALLLVGADDTTVNPDQNTTAFWGRILEKGGSARRIIYPGVGHIGAITAFAPLFRDRAPVLEDTVDFVEEKSASN
jgi:acetyl esterase/lipase